MRSHRALLAATAAGMLAVAGLAGGCSSHSYREREVVYAEPAGYAYGPPVVYEPVPYWDGYYRGGYYRDGRRRDNDWRHGRDWDGRWRNVDHHEHHEHHEHAEHAAHVEHHEHHERVENR